MNKLGIFSVIQILCILFNTTACTTTEQTIQNNIVPADEVKRTAGFPSENKEIKEVKNLGVVALGTEFPGLEGRNLRVRRITIAPGGVVGFHEHQKRPGFAYILEGEIVEHRDSGKTIIKHSRDSISFEKTGVNHWWENKGTTDVVALVADIVPEN
ncbi:MAG: cupin domain-containing protein [Cyanobacteria bacterium J06635_10]